MLGSGEILVMPCTPQVSHLYTHSPVWNANSKFCFLFSPDSLEKSKAWGKRNVDSLNLMPFNKSPIYTVSTWGKKWCMRAQNASPLDQEFVKFWILTFWKSFHFQKLFQYLIFMHRIGRRAFGCHVHVHTHYDVCDVIRLNIIIWSSW